MFPPGSSVLVAVSGGPDSICLLHSLARLRRLFSLELSSFHFDHRLRPGSDRDAAYARRQAERLGVPFHLRAAASGPRRGESVEAWAREARYGAMEAVRREVGATMAAVGHTADDQAETVLLWLCRGGGIDALSGMRPVSGTIVRPLLDVSRDQTQAFCRALGRRPRRDPANDDARFLRAALRGRVIPELERRLGRNVREAIVRAAELLREDADLLAAMAEQATDGLVRTPAPGEVRILARGLNELPGPLASRIVRRALWGIGAQPDSAAIGTVVDLAAGRRGRSVALADGLRAARTSEYVRVFRPSPGARARGDRPTDGEALHGDQARR
ncbi:MAG: tRNA lysidine(34) synthetase TilS [Actinobacteria bacterium]|nr:MAG: tRNA lysidine(34) synthetase TilS [Actinomycetota bacterium]